jgi:hypothetical protein
MVRSGFLGFGDGEWHSCETPSIGVGHVYQTLDARVRPVRQGLQTLALGSDITHGCYYYYY